MSMNIADIAAIVNAGGGGGGQPSGGGYDFVFSADSSSSEETIYSLKSGDFDAVKNKLQNHEPVVGFFYEFAEWSEACALYLQFYDVAYIEDLDLIQSTWINPFNSAETSIFTWTRSGEISKE